MRDQFPRFESLPLEIRLGNERNGRRAAGTGGVGERVRVDREGGGDALVRRTYSPSPIVTPTNHSLGEPDDYLHRNNYRPFLARIIP